jgi:hypothetical protein
MDLTTTCPTCGHVENASSTTCSFCGVELATDPEPVEAADASPADADPQNASDGKAEASDREKGHPGTTAQKPESVDEAIAHVLSAGDDEEPLDLVDVVDMDSASEAHTPPEKTTPAATAASPSAEPQPPAVEEVPDEKVALPEPVQLKAGAQGQPSIVNAAPEAAIAPPAAGAAEKKAQALEKQRAALAKAEALKKKKLAVARAVALKKKKAAMAQWPPAAANLHTRKLLQKYVGKTVGINYDNSAKIAPAELTGVNSDHLTVTVTSKNLRYHFPLATVLSIIEGADGKGVPTGAANEAFDAVVKIYPLVLF